MTAFHYQLGVATEYAGQAKAEAIKLLNEPVSVSDMREGLESIISLCGSVISRIETALEGE